MNNRKGFFSLQAIFFLMLISSAVFSYGYIAYVQNQKDLFRRVCYQDLADIQKSLIQSEKKLFLFNPESTALRLKLNVLYIELAAAIAAQNGAAVAKIAFEINQTKQAQVRLDKLQKFILIQAKNNLHFKLLTLNEELKIQKIFETSNWTPLLTDQRLYNLNLTTEIAVQPDSVGGLAPNYELQSEYRTIQKLQLSLQYRFTNNSQNQNYFKTEKSFEHTCTVTFQKKESVWELIINQDKPLSKL